MILRKESYKRAVWKNGLGFTDEVAIFPATASLAKGDFLWRVSSARIERASPFSVFPDHDRVLVILKGDGIRLTHTFVEGEAEETVDLPQYEVYEFPGDVPSRCDLIEGSVTDLSVFVRKAEVEPQVQVVDLDEGQDFDWQPSGRWNFAFAAVGNFEASSELLSEGDTLASTVAQVLQAKSPSAKLILIELF